jgi:hypothetical protein
VCSSDLYQCFCEGTIKNPRFPFLYGLGYVGDGVYKTKGFHKKTPYYVKWFNIFERCYNGVYPSYKTVKVCEEWHNFQNFAKWYEENWKSDYMDNKWSLDKDILVKGNKIYSPETCCFVPQEINSLFIKLNSRRGEYPIGVYLSKNKKYISNFTKGKRVTMYLGTYNTPEEAFQVYKETKESYIKEIADKWKGQISDKVYEAMYNYKVEIDD